MTTHLHLLPRLRMTGAIPTLLHAPSFTWVRMIQHRDGTANKGWPRIFFQYSIRISYIHTYTPHTHIHTTHTHTHHTHTYHLHIHTPHTHTPHTPHTHTHTTHTTYTHTTHTHTTHTHTHTHTTYTNNYHPKTRLVDGKICRM